MAETLPPPLIINHLLSQEALQALNFMASGGGLPHPLLPPPIHSPLHGHPGLGPHHFPQMPPIQSRPSSMPPTPSTPTYSGEYHPVDNVHTYADCAGVGGIKTFLEQLLCISSSDHDPPACLSDRSGVVRNFGHNGSLDVRHWPALHKTRYWGKTAKPLSRGSGCE